MLENPPWPCFALVIFHLFSRASLIFHLLVAFICSLGKEKKDIPIRDGDASTGEVSVHFGSAFGSNNLGLIDDLGLIDNLGLRDVHDLSLINNLSDDLRGAGGQDGCSGRNACKS